MEELSPVLRVSDGDEGFDPVLERAALQNGDRIPRRRYRRIIVRAFLVIGEKKLYNRIVLIR